MKCFFYQLFCVEIYDLAEMIYQIALQNEFHKTSLGHLDLHFQNLSSRIRRLAVEKNVEGFAAR